MYCKNCGKYSGKYELCKECYYEEENYSDEEYEEEPYCNCIICEEEKDDDGYLFCKNCYKKYRRKTVLIKIRNCTEIIPLASYYEGRYKCKDGHVVKSEPERKIDDWFYDNHIDHIYEPTYKISEREEINPDWKLPGYIKDIFGKPVDVYVEYWGIEGSDKYEEIKNYKLPIYKKDKVTLVNLTAENDKEDITAALEYKIMQKEHIKPHKINFKA